MRVLMVTTEYPPTQGGGIGRHVTALTRALRRHAGVTVLTTYRGGITTSEPGVVWANQDGPTPGKSQDGTPFAMLEDNITLAAAYNRLSAWGGHDFDIVHCHDYFGVLAAGALAAAGDVPLVMTKHFILRPDRDQDYLNLSAEAAAIRRRFRDYTMQLQAWSLARAGHLIAVSHAVRERLGALDVSTLSRCVTIHSGTDILAHPIRRQVEVVRRDLCRNGERILLLVGRLIRKKGGDVAIRALVVCQASYAG